jgi:hypothetical protein
MGMVQVGRNSDFVEEPFSPNNERQLGLQDFDRHLPVVLEVAGQIDSRHAPSANFPLDCVAVGEGGFETLEKVLHSVLAPLATH